MRADHDKIIRTCLFWLQTVFVYLKALRQPWSGDDGNMNGVIGFNTDKSQQNY